MWKLDIEERLSVWRHFRQSLDDLGLDESLNKVVDFWQSAPFSPYYLDPESPNTWPDPWTLLAENYYCDVAKALGMLYTIQLTKHSPDIEIRIYYDPQSKVNYNLVWVDDGKYVLNMTDGEVLNKKHLPESFKLKFRYAGKELSEQRNQ